MYAEDRTDQDPCGPINCEFPVKFASTAQFIQIGHCKESLTQCLIFFTFKRMSFREKSAWISLFCLLIFTTVWLTHALRIEFFGAENDNPMLWFFGTLAALIALEIGLHLAIAIQSPRDAKTPKDERERLID